MPTCTDISPYTSNVMADPEISGEIWAKTLQESAFMQLARRITIPDTGVQTQTITGEERKMGRRNQPQVREHPHLWHQDNHALQARGNRAVP